MLCHYSSPTVTALERYPDRAGRRSAAMLLELLDGRSWNSAAPTPSTLVVRETSRRAVQP
jgi:DNA-binding LacI/PurR family transcriptional regulator